MSFAQNTLGLQNQEVVDGVVGHWEVIHNASVQSVADEITNPQYPQERIEVTHHHRQLSAEEVAEWEMMGPINFYAANMDHWDEYAFNWHHFIPNPLQPPAGSPPATEQVANNQLVPPYPAFPMSYVPGAASTFAMRRTVSGTE